MTDNNVQMLVRLSSANEVSRRYFVTNGFDGALAMLALVLSFRLGDVVAADTVLRVCVGTAVALMISGISSAYVSESAERRREFAALQKSMVAELERSAHARAMHIVPWLIALVNGLAPLVVALVIVSPIYLAVIGFSLPVEPLYASIGVAFLVICVLGAFAGRISGASWLWSALRTAAIATVTAGLILLIQAW